MNVGSAPEIEKDADDSTNSDKKSDGPEKVQPRTPELEKAMAVSDEKSTAQTTGIASKQTQSRRETLNQLEPGSGGTNEEAPLLQDFKI